MELSGRPRDPSGALEGAFLEHFGPFWGVILEYLFRARWQLESSSILLLLKTFFYFFPYSAKMADIAPDS